MAFIPLSPRRLRYSLYLAWYFYGGGCRFCQSLYFLFLSAAHRFLSPSLMAATSFCSYRREPCRRPIATSIDSTPLVILKHYPSRGQSQRVCLILKWCSQEIILSVRVIDPSVGWCRWTSMPALCLNSQQEWNLLRSTLLKVWILTREQTWTIHPHTDAWTFLMNMRIIDASWRAIYPGYSPNITGTGE